MFRYNVENYEYVRNAYGDIVIIIKDGEPYAQYFYDAWGNSQVENYTNDNIRNIKPFRWKSHYYDAESELYYANGSYYDPKVGLHLDAAGISSVIENAFTVFGFDINGIMCDNILAYLPYIYTILTTLELSPDPAYDPDANKPWWELWWNGIARWFASAVKWFNELDIGWQIGLGLVFFDVACIITMLTAGMGTPAAWIAVW